ncbi:MAG: SpaA isopeptide-forming pilin-related protein, partial [Eubacteriales bacterium]|nr:SpaA isopeptide-forming pilin-related protein [Eubacteriales bacterium]
SEADEENPDGEEPSGADEENPDGEESSGTEEADVGENPNGEEPSEAEEENPEEEEPSENEDASEETEEELEAPEEEKPEEESPGILVYEDDEIIVTVEAVAEDAIPKGVKLAVAPIKKETEGGLGDAKYEQISTELQQQTTGADWEVAGFLAYDISLIEEETGEEVEPDGEVKVAIQYKEAAIPEEVTEIIENIEEENRAAIEAANAAMNAGLDVTSEESEGYSADVSADGIDGNYEGDLLDAGAPEDGDHQVNEDLIENPAILTEIKFVNFNVTIHHMEENEAGEVENVVDLAETDQLLNLEITENQEVQSVEFVTDSFSTYSARWEMNGGAVEVAQHYGTVDAQGVFHEYPESKVSNGNAPRIFSGTVADYNTTQIETGNIPLSNGRANNLSGTPQIYVSNTAITGNLTNNGNAKQASTLNIRRLWQPGGSDYANYTYQIYYDNYQWLGTKPNIWQEPVHVYYVYEEGTQGGLTTVKTVDNNDYGITLTMQDYSWNDGSTHHYQTTQNRDYTVDFHDSYGTYNAGAHLGLLRDQLVNGYPVSRQDGTSLSGLFNRGQTVNGLFQLKDGYLEYSSFENFAHLDQSTGMFRVYDQIGTPYNTSDPYEGNHWYYKRGNFLPYNDITASDPSDQRNTYSEEGMEELDSNDPRKGEVLYKTQGETDYYFGMSMDVNFLQPKNGIVNNQDMLFWFNGDDDMWVYIDGLLMLDIGGVHDAQKGTIDFKTGVIQVIANPTGDALVNSIQNKYTITRDGHHTYYNTTIKKLFELSGKFPDGTDWDASKVDLYFKGETFADYSSHNLKMYYMERGAGASNLHIKFNLQTIPAQQFSVTKTLEGTDKGDYSQQEYSFKAYIQKMEGRTEHQENFVFLSEYGLLTGPNPMTQNDNQEVVIVDKDTGEAIPIGADGIFKLKAGQTAIFRGPGLYANRGFYVEEVNIDRQKYPTVDVNGQSTIPDNNGTVSSDRNTIDKRPELRFGNHPAGRDLEITKQIANNAEVVEKFKFQIQLKKENDYVSYSSGIYYMKNEDGTLVQETSADTGESHPKEYRTDADGWTGPVAPGQTIVIRGFLDDTEFQILEDVYSGNGLKYLDPVITWNEHCSNVSVSQDNAKQVRASFDSSNETAAVTYTNQPYKILHLYKVDAGNTTQMLPGAEFTLYEAARDETGSLVVDEDGNPTVDETKATELISDDTGTLVQKSNRKETPNLLYGTYILRETKAPEGYTMATTDLVIEVTDSGVSIRDHGYLEEGTHYPAIGQYTFKIKNPKIYNLPETGGRGTYLFTISGVAILMSTLLLMIKNQRKETGRHLTH